MFVIITDAVTSQLERAPIHSPVTFTVCYMDYSVFYCFLLLVMACRYVLVVCDSFVWRVTVEVTMTMVVIYLSNMQATKWTYGLGLEITFEVKLTSGPPEGCPRPAWKCFARSPRFTLSYVFGKWSISVTDHRLIMCAYVFLQVEQHLLFLVRELWKYPLQQLLLFPFAKMGAHHCNCLQPEDMVFDQMLVKQYSEFRYRLGVCLRNRWSIVSELFLNIQSFKVCLKVARRCLHIYNFCWPVHFQYNCFCA